jgi:peptide/nickel transport system substrate-binding protein
VHLLGPVEATRDGRTIPLGAAKQRALLAMLALDANATVSVNRLVDGLWGDDPPASAAKMVQLYVSQLRRLLAGDEAQILTHGRGYELRLAQGDAIDAARFQRLVEQADRGGGGTASGPGDPAREALALWRGDALADVAGEPFAGPEVRRLDELWLRAAHLVVDGDLAAGRDEEALARLERLIRHYPLRERLHAQRMLALYRSGRQAEALEAYVAARRQLVDEVGVEPGAELQELHERMLRHDPELHRWPPSAATLPPTPSGDDGPPSAPPRSPGSTAGRPPIVPLAAGLVLILASVAVLVIGRLTGSDRRESIEEGAVGVIDPHAAAVSAQYRIGSEAQAVAAGAGSVWVASPLAGTVVRIHGGRAPVDTIDVGPDPTALAFGGGSLWVAGGDDGAVAQVDPATNRVVQRIPVGNGLRGLAVGHGALWAATALDGEVVRIDLRSGGVTRRAAVGGQPVALAASRGAVWAAREDVGQVARIDPRTGDVVDAIDVGNGPSAVAAGLGSVWTANRQDGTVSRIDPATDRVTSTVEAGRAPATLAIAQGALWVGDEGGTVLRLDPRSGAITDTVRIGSTPEGLAPVDGALWVTTGAPPTAHRGGTLRVGRPVIALDPALGGYDPAAAGVLDLAYEGLVRYRRAGGAAGARMEAGLAVDVPEPADGGRRYVFRLRPGLRYSDGRPVHAGDFRASMERMLRIQGVDVPPLFDAVAGVARCRAGTAPCDLSRGIASDDRTSTIALRLTRPDPDLLPLLAGPLAAVLPASTPRRALPAQPIPGTGPYRVGQVVPGGRALLTRNPHFRGPVQAGRTAGLADRIAVAMAQDPRANVAALERGRLDITNLYGDLPARDMAALRTRVGARLRTGQWPQTVYAFLNVQAAPFDDRRVRRALNFAVDRRLLVDRFGGRDAGSPTCQLLPSGLPGYRPSCSFTAAPSPSGAWTAPDTARARRLVAASGRRGTAVVVWGTRGWRGLGEHLVDVLDRLGFPSRLRTFDDLRELNAAARDPRRRPQIGVTGWSADFPEPGGFLRSLVSCGSDVRRDPGGLNLSRFCDRRLDGAITRAQAAGLAAGSAWQRLERRVAAQAPVVPLVDARWAVVTSPRAGNVQFHPQGGPLLDQIWVR